MVAQERTPGTEDRHVTIPFLPDILYSTYTVRSGDYLLKVAAEHHGLSVQQLPEDYLGTLKKANPGIENLDRIYPGQKVRIPELASGGSRSKIPSPVPPPAAGNHATSSAEAPASWSRSSALSAGVKQLGGTLIESGHYFFPAKDKGEMELNVSDFPVIEMQGGHRFLLDTGQGLPDDMEKTIRTFWKHLTIIRTEPGESQQSVLDKVFRTIHGGDVRQTVDISMSDIGIHVTLRADWILVDKKDEDNPPGYHCITLITDPQERSSAALQAYLAEKNIRISDVLPEGVHEDNPTENQANPAKHSILTVDASSPEIFVAELAKAMGYSYNVDVPISFQYAGSQIQTATNLIHGENGLDLVVDYGTLYGDAKLAVEATGLKVISVTAEDTVPKIAHKIFRAAGIAWTDDPIFFGANRNVFKTPSVTIPGFLASHGDRGGMLLTSSPLPAALCDFLSERGIRVAKMKPG
jgi:hypothetical protein